MNSNKKIVVLGAGIAGSSTAIGLKKLGFNVTAISGKEEKIDLNMDSKAAREFIKETLISMCKNGASIIRLDAFAYAIKQPGTSCFFIEPEM